MGPHKRQRLFKDWLGTTAEEVAQREGYEYLYWRRVAGPDTQFSAVARKRDGGEIDIPFPSDKTALVPQWMEWVATGAGNPPGIDMEQERHVEPAAAPLLQQRARIAASRGR